MRYIFWKLHKSMIRSLIFFLMGIYTGLIIYMYFHGNKLDMIYTRNKQLGQQLAQCEGELRTYQEEEQQRIKRQLIRSINFIFMEKLDPYIETELLKTLVEETHFIVGKKTEDVAKNPEFLYQLLNNKIFKAKDTTFEIKVRIIYIHTTTEIWVSAKEK